MKMVALASPSTSTYYWAWSRNLRAFVAAALPLNSGGRAIFGKVSTGRDCRRKRMSIVSAVTEENVNPPASDAGDVIMQYVVLRRDLIDTWPLGSVVAKSCHAFITAIWSHKDGPITIEYHSPSNLDSMHKEDDDFATPCPVSASFRRVPKTKTIRRCKNSPPRKRSKSSLRSKENFPPLICKGESPLAIHRTVGCRPLDIPIACSIEPQLYSLSDEQPVLGDAVAGEVHRESSPPVNPAESCEQSKENIQPLICEDEATLAFHGTGDFQPLDIPTTCSIESQLYSLSDEQLHLGDEVPDEVHRLSSPLVNQPEPCEQSKVKISLLDCKDDANLAFHRTFGGQPLDIPADSKKPHSCSIESLLLSSSREQQVVRDEFADEAEGDFESNSQLDLLIRLCSDANEIGVSSCSLTVPVAVECPICGLDISDLNEEARQLHTNACLDNCDSPQISCKNDRTAQNLLETDSAFSVGSTRQVADWLQSLGLEKYKEAFTREEIDWETLKWMTEEDLTTIGVTALGPRKKIVQALEELRKGGVQSIPTEAEMDNSTVGPSKKLAASRLITDYFLGPGGEKKKSMIQSRGQQVIGKDQPHSNRRRINNKRHVTSRKPRDLPLWCTIPGTPFRVDAFRYLRRDCTHWFLSHFHADHYQGLTRSFSHGKIYCSMITARLVHMKIGIPWDTLEVLPLNRRVNIGGVHVTCFDANHCPGAVVILFEPPNGKAVLHTGDFRFCEEMASLTALTGCPIHTLILDTTYCNPQYDFPKQEAIIQFVIEAIQAETFHQKTLFLIGSYTIGKERVFLEVARVLRKKVYVTAAKLRILECLELPKEDMQWLTTNEYESQIHVVPLWSLASFKRLKQLSNQYSGRFSLIVAFSPTGWSFGKGKKSTGKRWQQGTIIRYEVPYSEHSSFTELKQFVKLISPVDIIPSVNNHGEESSMAMVSQLLS